MFIMFNVLRPVRDTFPSKVQGGNETHHATEPVASDGELMTRGVGCLGGDGEVVGGRLGLLVGLHGTFVSLAVFTAKVEFGVDVDGGVVHGFPAVDALEDDDNLVHFRNLDREAFKATFGWAKLLKHSERLLSGVGEGVEEATFGEILRAGCFIVTICRHRQHCEQICQM